MNRSATSKRTRDQLALFSMRSYVERLDSLDEITEWLGTFRERLRMARMHEQQELTAIVAELETHFRRRRAELS
ncbi:MAG TPA: hypothetical protein VFR33_00050 [Candidatus Dormibacteraeota bacterium]|nr:hypothetical protein [Candidatus Dormibacteraeota bacterium]